MIYEVSEKKTKRDPERIDLTERTENQYELTVGGRTSQLSVARSGLAIFSIIQDGRHYEAIVEEKGPHDFDVLIQGRLFHLEAVDERNLLLAQQSKMAASGPQAIDAEMPGKVVKVNFAVGDAVEEGQGVVVLEAMKMENEIPSPIEGVVAELAVEEGQTVEGGARLFVVEPAPSGETPD